MMTPAQVEELKQLFQIDGSTIWREYLQITFLSYFYQEKTAGKYAFKGGTALRLIYGSPRFSEDLDFSTTEGEEAIMRLLKKVEVKLQRELPSLVIVPWYKGKEGVRLRIRYTRPDWKYSLNIRLDFHQEVKIRDTELSTLSTRLPVLVFPQIFHLTRAGIMKEKLRAITERGKGRDLFDLWYLLMRGEVATMSKRQEMEIREKIGKFADKELTRDLGKFLPVGQRGILKKLKKELLERLGEC